jgi:hypothetical protein
MNDGLRPHYDPEFDEAIEFTINHKTLAPNHKEALRRICGCENNPKPLANAEPFVLQQE